jgi:hypothetical protein
MGKEPAARQIRIIDSRCRIREVLDFLLSSAEPEGVDVLRAIPRYTFDVLLLDVRRLTSASENEPQDVPKICPSLLGAFWSSLLKRRSSRQWRCSAAMMFRLVPIPGW